DYDTNIQYHPRKANVVADALSRKSGMIVDIKHGYWASLRVEPDLISQIKEAQKGDIEIWAIVENLAEPTEFHLDEDDVLWQGTRLCVPNDATLREALLTEAHSSPFSIHPGSTKMYYDLKQHFWWSGMKRDPLDIPVWKWDKISMDFVTELPRTRRRHDAIWVVLDRLTKSAYFLPIRKDYSVSKLAETFQQEIVRLHGTPKSYADKHRRSIEFQPGDRVFLKVSPSCGVRRFSIKGKLSPRFIRPFEILDRVGE
nr:retrotransposon protein, putative, Ty3-gypsy subclass [Tanacetum cinerariifolium]